MHNESAHEMSDAQISCTKVLAFYAVKWTYNILLRRYEGVVHKWLIYQTYEGRLAESKTAIQNLQKEREDAIKMMELKEDVIGLVTFH